MKNSNFMEFHVDFSYEVVYHGDYLYSVDDPKALQQGFSVEFTYITEICCFDLEVCSNASISVALFW
jgi:hypothetical protein